MPRASPLSRLARFVRENDGLGNTLAIAWRKIRRCGPGDALRATLSHLSPSPRWPARRYRRFIVLHEPPPDPRALAAEVAALRHPPSLSLIVPADLEEIRPAPRAEERPGSIMPALRDTLASLEASVLPPLERIVVANPRHIETGVLPPSCRLVAHPGGDAPAAALNGALQSATGTYVALVWPGDRLPPHALLRVAQALQRHPGTELLYTDEDQLAPGGRRRRLPVFKPQWSPDTLLAYPYIGDLAVFRREALLAAGGFRPGLGGATAYDACLRVSERGGPVRRTPGVLYHRAAPCAAWRDGIADIPGFAAALRDAVARRGLAARVREPPASPSAPGIPPDDRPCLVYDVRDEPLVSIIIPTRNHGRDVETCLASLFGRSTWHPFEVLLIDNGSDDPASLALFARWRETHGVRVLRRDEPFNFSRLNNAAAREAAGAFLLFLNNDAEVLSPDWLEHMLGFAQQPHVGAVGARLLYPDGTLQHAGVAKVGEGPTHVFGRLPPDHPHPRCRLDGNWSAVTAACLMIARERFAAVGGFDEDLAVAYNDVDLCFRLLDRGWYNVLATHAVLLHHEFRSRGHDRAHAGKRARQAGELQRLYARWPQFLDDPGYNPNLSTDLPDFSPRN